eukprot:scaffold25.g5137.t1
MAEALQRQLEEAGQSVDRLRELVTSTSSPNDAESVKVKEQALARLTDELVLAGAAAALAALLSELRPLFAAIPKAKTAKIVRTVIDSIDRVPGSTQLLVDVCKEQAEWATAERRTFLRQRIEIKLAGLYLAAREFNTALALIAKLLTEVKRLDDKLLLVDIHLLESRAHHALKNLPKSRAALTAARTAANAIYIPPLLQAEIDTQSGTLHAEEKDYKTAYSYFFEAFEQYSALDDPHAVAVLKYMLLTKVTTGEVHDVPAIISSKGGLKYAGADVDAMRAVAKAHEDRSLQQFQAALEAYAPQARGAGGGGGGGRAGAAGAGGAAARLCSRRGGGVGVLVEDPIVHAHLSELYDILLEQNLIRLIEPFSRVEVAHVEAKISWMILDKKFAGTLNAGEGGTLEVFDAPEADPIYPAALETLDSMGRVVESLYQRSTRIVA